MGERITDRLISVLDPASELAEAIEKQTPNYSTAASQRSFGKSNPTCGAAAH